MSLGGWKTASTLLHKWSLGEMKSLVVYTGPFRYPKGFGSALSCPDTGPVPISFDHVLPFSGKRNQQFLQCLCTENISICTGQHLRKLIPLHRGWTLLLTCWRADTKLLFLQLHFKAAWEEKKKKGVCSEVQMSAFMNWLLHRQEQRGLKRWATHSLEAVGSSWLAIDTTWPRRICVRLVSVFNGPVGETRIPEGGQETQRRPEQGQAHDWIWAALNLWVVSAAGCVTHSSSLLWSVLICYWLNTLRYFMYLSASSFRADLYHPSQELEQEAKVGFWICGKCIFRLFSTALLLESLLPELAGHTAVVWLRVPAAALDLPAAECFRPG